MKVAVFALAAATLALPSAASAQSGEGFFVGGKVSTLGLGAEAGYRFNRLVTVRASATGYTYETDQTLDDIDSSVDLGLGAYGVILDYHPFANAFYVSAGAFANQNEVDTLATPANPVEIGNTTYTPAEIGTVYGNGSFDDFAPYAGIGGAWAFGDGGWEFAAEAGAYFQGSPEITYRADGQLANDPSFQADLRAEAARAQGDLEEYDTYPVVSLMLRRRF